MADEDFITLISSDKRKFLIPMEAGTLSKFITNQMEKHWNPAKEVSLIKYDGDILANVVEYLCKHGDAVNEEETKIFNSTFLSGEDPTLEMLFDTVLAAYDLGIQGLGDLVAKRIAYRIQDATVDWVRTVFGIQNDEQVVDNEPEQSIEGVDGDDNDDDEDEVKSDYRIDDS